MAWRLPLLLSYMCTLDGFLVWAGDNSDDVLKHHASLRQKALAQSLGWIWDSLAVPPVEGLGAACRGGEAFNACFVVLPGSASYFLAGKVLQRQAYDARGSVVERLGGKDEEWDGMTGPMAGSARTVQQDDFAAIGNPRSFAHGRPSSVLTDGCSGTPTLPAKRLTASRGSGDGRNERPKGADTFVNTGMLWDILDSSLSVMVIWRPCRSSPRRIVPGTIAKTVFTRRRQPCAGRTRAKCQISRTPP